MGWKKYFKVVDTNGNFGPVNGSNSHPTEPRHSNIGNVLPEVYKGAQNRLERYLQYDLMDMDSEINSALDILAEFCTQVDEEENLGFNLHYKETPTETEAELLKKQLQAWYHLNKFEKRLFKIFRNVLLYGDQIFLRDPETFELFWIAMVDVVKVIVNESEGKKPEQYVIKNVNPNFENMSVTQVPHEQQYGTALSSGSGGSTATSAGYNSSGGTSTTGRFQHGLQERTMDAENVVHLSLTEGLDANWPFGNSILELIFKVYKQKELLEDSIIIYRVQRAPERRVFYIDVGNMPSHLAMQFVERVKNEMHQRRLPSRGGGGNFVDATYNTVGVNEDFFFPQTAEGRGSKVDTLPGGSNLSEIDDLRFFTNKMLRGLRIPSSYLPTGPEDSQATYNDGKMGTALIQEYRFNQYCKRLQNLICSVLDTEFKTFLKWRGINIDSSIFELRFNEPQNFAHYREAELATVKIGTFSSLEGYSYFSKRFLMTKYLGLKPDEMLENAKLWREENQDAIDIEGDKPDLRNLGITPGGIDSDLESLGPIDGEDGGEEGEGTEPGAGGEVNAAGGTAAGSAPPTGGEGGPGNLG